MATAFNSRPTLLRGLLSGGPPPLSPLQICPLLPAPLARGSVPLQPLSTLQPLKAAQGT